jgi:hypothetical protein
VSAATQFRLNTDLGFTTVIAFSRAPLDETLVQAFGKIHENRGAPRSFQIAEDTDFR